MKIPEDEVEEYKTKIMKKQRDADENKL